MHRDQVWNARGYGRGEEIRGRRGVPGQGAAEDQAQGALSSSHCVRSTTCEAASGSCAFSYADETPDLTVARRNVGECPVRSDDGPPPV